MVQRLEGGCEAVTPHDSTNLAQTCTRLWVGGAGSGALAVVFTDGTVCAMTGVVVGMYELPPFIRVNDTNTDVTAMVAFYGMTK